MAAESRVKSTIVYGKLYDLVKKHLPDVTSTTEWQEVEDEEALVVAFPMFFEALAKETQRVNSSDLKKAFYELYRAPSRIQSSASGAFAGALAECMKYVQGRKGSLLKAPKAVQSVVKQLTWKLPTSPPSRSLSAQSSPDSASSVPPPQSPPRTDNSREHQAQWDKMRAAKSAQWDKVSKCADQATSLKDLREDAQRLWQMDVPQKVTISDSPISLCSSQDLTSPLRSEKTSDIQATRSTSICI